MPNLRVAPVATLVTRRHPFRVPGHPGVARPTSGRAFAGGPFGMGPMDHVAPTAGHGTELQNTIPALDPRQPTHGARELRAIHERVFFGLPVGFFRLR